MILADSTIWIDHFRRADPGFQYELDLHNVSMHPFIVAELALGLALGSLHNRVRTIAALEDLPQVNLATLADVRRLIEVHGLHGKGIGVVDAHLLASTLITPWTQLWTRDKRLRDAGKMLGIDASLT